MMTVSELHAALDAATCLVEETRQRDEDLRRQSIEAGAAYGAALTAQRKALDAYLAATRETK